MKRNILLLSICLISLAFVENVQAQNNVLEGEKASQRISQAEIIRLKGEEQHISYLLFKKDSQVKIAQLFSYLRDSLGMSAAYSFQQIDQQEDNLGEVQLRFQQFYMGVPIRSAHLIAHTKNGMVLAISGLFFTTPISTQTINLNKKEALKLALNSIGAKKYKWEIPAEERFIKIEQKDSKATFYPRAELYYFGNHLGIKTQDQLLCYRFDIYAQEPLSRDYVYVNANTGSIVFVESRIMHSNTYTTAQTAYSNTRNIVTDSVMHNVFRLSESTRGNGISTYNMKNGTSYSNAVDFIDSTNTWTTFNPAINQYAIDAHWGAEMTYDYYDQTYNRNSINNQGFALRNYVHYKNNYVNAFWDGQRMTYGDGDNLTNPLTSVDIIGHEITHGLTRFTSNLIYAKESGALNESYSDIFGLAVERFSRPNNWNWEIGEDIGGAFRNMAKPNLHQNPDTYGGLYWTSQLNCVPTKSNDKCGVHNNSGVQNYWFYLLSHGGLGINDKGDSIKVDSIGVSKAAAIAFRTNTVYLSPSSDYSDARYFSFRSAVDLYGGCSPEVKATVNAWHGVGVGPAYKAGIWANFVAVNDTAFCGSPAQVKFTSQSNNVYNYKWYFGDGDSSTLRSPIHTYLNNGNYKVSFYADGGSCGKDSLIRPNYININSSIECLTALNGTRTTNDCAGRFYDNGGLNGQYSLGKSDTLYIQPNNTDRILLEFTHLNIEAGNIGFCNKDYVEVFDGKTTESPTLGRFCNSILPPDSIYSSSNALTVVFYSDRETSMRGFGAQWKCVVAAQAPIADFKAATDSSCDGRLKFYDLSKNGVNYWNWNFGDGNFSNAKNPSHEYDSNGTYNVKLSVRNSIGGDSLQKNALVYVNRPPMPIGNSDTTCYNGKLILGVNPQTNNKWYLSKESDHAIFTGDSLPFNHLKSKKTYYVENLVQSAKKTFVPFTINGNSYYSDSTAAMYFNVEKPIILESVIVYSNAARHRTFVIRNSKGNIIRSKSTYVSASALQVSLDFVLYPDTGYSISIDDRNPGFLINSTGASFPYKEPGLIEVTRSSLGGNTFPFFFYWTVRPLSCRSPRLKISAVVDTSCTITSLNQTVKSDKMLKVYPNPFIDNLSISFENLVENCSLYLYNSEGRLIFSEINVSTTELHSLDWGKIALSNGVYFLKIQTENKVYQQKLIKLEF